MSEKEFKYDPEGEEESGAKKYRLPFALCKAAGIQIQDWWRPRDAWEALRNGGHIKNVSDEYAEYYRNIKKEEAKKRRTQYNERQKRIKEQMSNLEHIPEKNYTHMAGAIAGAKKETPMTFEQADSGNVNPFFDKGFIGYRTNCQTCVAVYVARRQGYDVRALPNLNNKYIAALSFNSLAIYQNKDGNMPKSIKRPYRERITSFLDKNVEENKIYTLQMLWTGRSSGHIVTVERDNGVVRVYDPQTNRIYKGKQIYSFMSKVSNVSLADVTDCTIKEEWADRIMKRSKK